MVRPTPAIAAIPATTPFVGPEQLMRERGLRELLRLGANESPFGPSPRAIAAMTAELPRLAWYGDPESLDLRDALAIKHGCEPAQIVVGSGIDDLMGLAVRAFVSPGAVVLTTRGTYPTLEYHAIGYGATLARAGYREDGTLDLDALLALARETRPALVYLANPDNPSGSFVERADVERFFQELPGDCLLLLDEAYADFVAEAALMPAHFDDRLVRLRTFSKVYGMAGARIGYALVSAANARTFQKIRLHYGVNRNAQVGALAALRDDSFRDYVIAETRRARAACYALASELGCRYVESHANFVCLDLGTPQRAVRVVDELLERGVWIRKPGAPPLDRFVRVSAGTEPMRAAFALALRSVLAKVPA
ncbi:MAG TPA: aminotransferase class I/II-fold pyridoxal phosphate-dependent enzyme [Candidatus Tumulicola sp.]|jgi:histidinol-phosphate aminotransferase